jgi:hypothetical protein
MYYSSSAGRVQTSPVFQLGDRAIGKKGRQFLVK